MAVALDLSGRRILAVGASSGIGRAVARLAHAAGARVALAARRKDRLDSLAAELGDGALPIVCDVTDPAACMRAVDACVDAFSGLDDFVFASGMSPLVPLVEATAGEWRAVLDVNVAGASHLTRAAISQLRENRGRAVYLSSYSVRQSLPGLSLYSVSKVALDALIGAWRLEHPDVMFTRVVVGNTLGTEFADAWDEERRSAAVRGWVEQGLFQAPTIMPLDVCAESILSVLAVRGHVDDLAIMPRPGDVPAKS